MQGLAAAQRQYDRQEPTERAARFDDLYRVSIDFRGAPSFLVEVAAADLVEAKFQALAQARASGWDEPAVKFTVTAA